MMALVQWFEKTTLSEKRPAHIAFLTLFYVFVIRFLLKHYKGLRKMTFMKIKEKVFRLARFVPQVQN